MQGLLKTRMNLTNNIFANRGNVIHLLQTYFDNVIYRRSCVNQIIDPSVLIISIRLAQMVAGEMESADFMEVILKQLHARIAETNEQIRKLTAQSQSYETTLDDLTKSEMKLFVVHLGGEYFVEKAKGEAKNFLVSKITSINQQVKMLEVRAIEIGKSLNQMSNGVEADSSTVETNEEGLPFMEIIETLDDDGSIISAKVNKEEVYVNRQHNSNTEGRDTLTESKLYLQLKEATPFHHKAHKPSTNADIEKPTEITTSDGEDRLEDLMREMHVLPASVNENENKIKKIARMVNDLPIEAEHKSLVAESLESTVDLTQMVKKNSTLVSDENTPGAIKDFTEASKSLDIDNIIELEIIADQIDEPGNDEYIMEEVGEFDYDFEDFDIDHDDDDGDDLADELLYGKKPSFFSDDSINELLWEQVSKLRSAGKEQGDAVNIEKSKKSVRFANTLQIKEIENVSEALKKVEHQKPASLFKQRGTSLLNFCTRLDAKNSDQSEQIQNIREINPHVALNDEVVENNIEHVCQNVVEETFKTPGSKLTLLEVDTKPKLSKFKQLKHEKSSSETQYDQHNAKKGNEIVEEFIRERAPIYELHSEVELKSALVGNTMVMHPVDSVVKKNNLTKLVDHESSRADNFKRTTSNDYSYEADQKYLLNNMMQAYVSGEYDDDIETTGPVVQELDDFEVLNKVLESKEYRNQEPHVDDNTESMEEEEDEYESSQILEDDIVEHEIDFDSEDEFEEESKSDFYLLNKEVSETYHKLRQKLIFDKKADIYSTENLEFEPIDEHGNSIKISKFKASRSS